MEASAGFEPANNGFANRPLKPLGYDAVLLNILKYYQKMKVNLHSVFLFLQRTHNYFI